jgi:hypothetical protein
MMLVHRVAQWIVFHEGFRVLPVVVVRTAQQNADVKTNIHKVGGDQLPVHDHTRRDKHLAAPVRHVLVGIVAMVGIVE